MSSISQCRHDEDMCANKHPENDGCIFNDSRDIQQTSTLGLTDPARVPVLHTEREFRRVNENNSNLKICRCSVGRSLYRSPILACVDK